MRGQGHIVKPYMMAVRQQYKCCTCPPPLQLKQLIHRLVLLTHRHVGCDKVQEFSIHKGAEQGQDVGVPAERGCREGGRGAGVRRKMVGCLQSEVPAEIGQEKDKGKVCGCWDPCLVRAGACGGPNYGRLWYGDKKGRCP